VSDPYKFFGNWFFEAESTIAAASTGDGTGAPIIWNRNDGSIADDQICRFQVAAKECVLTCNGFVTVEFLDHTGGGASPVSQTVPFALISTFTWPGTDCSVREPVASDWFTSDQTYFIFNDSQNISVTLPWGTAIVTVAVTGNIGGFGSTPLWVITGTSYSQYVKSVGFDFVGEAVQGTFVDSSILVSTGSSGKTDLGTRMDILHSDAELYYATTGSASVTFSDFKAVLTDEFAQPPDL
jgi:hypothetical protein